MSLTAIAPVVAIIGQDLKFYDSLAKLFPHNLSARNWFAGDANKAVADATAFRNSTLQGAYFMLAARAVGLDCGPMSGFDAAKVDAEFFPGGRVRTNFICSIGHGDPSKLFERSPRFAPDGRKLFFVRTDAIGGGGGGFGRPDGPPRERN